MTSWGREERPDRLYTLTGGRSRGDAQRFGLVTLVAGESEPTPGMQSEHAAILRICRTPTAVVEIAADLELPVNIVRILLGDLLAAGRISVRPPPPGAPSALPGGRAAPDTELLRQVLAGLRGL